MNLIQEIIQEGKRLGRHISTEDWGVFDHLFEARLPLDLKKKPFDKVWGRWIPPFDQGQLGSCTGNGSLGLLGTDPFYSTLKSANDLPELDEPEAVKIYSQATRLDGGGADQYYPPNDDGATVLGAMKALKALGLVKGYAWGFNANSILCALSQYAPVAVGFNWYDSFDSPDSNGVVKISPNASVRGGHCWEINQVDVENRRVWAVNSWGSGWARNGTFGFSWDDLDRLISESGEVATVVI